MPKEFESLSETEEMSYMDERAVYRRESIKEFIKKTIEDLNDFKLGRDQIIFRFEKRAGEKLIK